MRGEAQALASILKEAGVGEQEIIVRLDEMAHEESYRRQAHGCGSRASGLPCKCSRACVQILPLPRSPGPR